MKKGILICIIILLVPFVSNAASFSQSEYRIFAGWISYIDTQQKDFSDFVSQAALSGRKVGYGNQLSAVQNQQSYLKLLKSQMLSAVAKGDRTAFSKLAKSANDSISKFDSLMISAKKSDSEAEEGDYRQSLINNLNKQYADYKKAQQDNEAEFAALLRQRVPTVVTPSLNAAGISQQIHCSFSPVGGMTANSGSMTCY